MIIIKDRTVDRAGIPPDNNNQDLARHIEIESGDTQKLESRHGDRLMSVRNSIETERQEILIDLSTDPKDLPEKLPRGFIDALFWMIVFDRQDSMSELSGHLIKSAFLSSNLTSPLLRGRRLRSTTSNSPKRLTRLMIRESHNPAGTRIRRS